MKYLSAARLQTTAPETQSGRHGTGAICPQRMADCMQPPIRVKRELGVRNSYSSSYQLIRNFNHIGTLANQVQFLPALHESLLEWFNDEHNA